MTPPRTPTPSRSSLPTPLSLLSPLSSYSHDQSSPEPKIPTLLRRRLTPLPPPHPSATAPPRRPSAAAPPTPDLHRSAPETPFFARLPEHISSLPSLLREPEVAATSPPPRTWRHSNKPTSPSSR